MKRVSLFKQIVLLIVHAMLIFGSVLCIKFVYSWILPEKTVKQDFKMTYCSILARKISYSGHLVNKYRADFLVKYNIYDQEFTVWTSGSGIKKVYVPNYQQQFFILQQFNIGESYPCWYDPQHLENIALVVNYNWLSTLPLVLPLVVGCMAFFFLVIELRNFYLQCVLLHIKRKNRKKFFKLFWE